MTVRQLGVRRVAMLSVHTSPLDRPGSGDAGGMNVYVRQLAQQLAELGVEVDIFTRSTSSRLPPRVEVADGVTVRHVAAGPYERLRKEDLPAQLCGVVHDVLRTDAEQRDYDLIHSHYWLSGQVGMVAAEQWSVPLVHSMHTMAKVKNAALAAGDDPEPDGRIAGEQQLVAVADRLIANTDDEATALVRRYDADPDKVEVVHPGVDLSIFHPRTDARSDLGLPAESDVVLFAGRIQPLKAPDLLLRAIARLVEEQPHRREHLVVAVIGGTSGMRQPMALEQLAGELGITDVVRFLPPVEQATLARWHAAASVVCVPSYTESFGLVALEAQACGTPVVAAAVGGLPTAVRDGVSGTLVRSREPAEYATAIGRLLDDPALRTRMGDAGVAHAQRFSWRHTAARTLRVYNAAAGHYAAYDSEAAS